MNSWELSSILRHFDELEYGLSNLDVKKYGIRKFCRRRLRRVGDKRISLYVLTDEWLQYVKEQKALMYHSNSLNELAGTESKKSEAQNSPFCAHTHPADTYLPFSSKLKQTEIANSFLDDEIKEFVNLVDEQLNVAPSIRDMGPFWDTAFVDSNKEALNSSENRSSLLEPHNSSFLDEYHKRSILIHHITCSFTDGECETTNLFERAILLQRCIDKLCEDGLTDEEVIKTELFPIIADYLELTENNKYKLMLESQLYFQYQTYKYYLQYIEEYLRTIPKLPNCELKELPLSIFETTNNESYIKRRISLYVRIVVVASILANDNNRDIKLLFDKISKVNETEIQDIIDRVSMKELNDTIINEE